MLRGRKSICVAHQTIQKREPFSITPKTRYIATAGAIAIWVKPHQRTRPSKRGWHGRRGSTPPAQTPAQRLMARSPMGWHTALELFAGPWLGLSPTAANTDINAACAAAADIARRRCGRSTLLSCSPQQKLQYYNSQCFTTIEY